MTRDELRDKITDAIEQAFSGTQRRADGKFRPALDRTDCEFIADLVYSTIGRSSLGIYDHAAVSKK